MRKSRNQNINSPTYNLDDEVNIREYPYYRSSPVKYIAKKQQQLIQQYNPPPLTQHTVRYEEFPHLKSMYKEQEYQGQQEQQEYQGQQEQQEYRGQQEYIGPPPLPVFNIVSIPGENDYRVDMRTMEEKLEEMRQEIDTNAEKLVEQRQAMSVNEESIQKQVEIINTHNGTINNNTAHIQQQIQVYNHNTTVIQQQACTYQLNATHIVTQQETLSGLQSQILECEEQLEQLKQETESQQQQLAYHGTMINAFNTMLQNPQYFTQLMAMSLSSMSPPDQ